MSGIAIALGTFAVVTSFAIWLQSYKQISYARGWLLYIPLYLTAVSWLVFSSEFELKSYFLGMNTLVISICAIALFVLLELCRNTIWTKQQYYKSNTLPDAYGDLLEPKSTGIIVKAVEIFFQDLVALILILSLLNYFSLSVTTVLFVFIVAAVHVPGLKYFGFFYGGMFLVYSTVLSILVPWLVTSTAIGFVLVYSLHLLMYPVMMGIMRLLR